MLTQDFLLLKSRSDGEQAALNIRHSRGTTRGRSRNRTNTLLHGACNLYQASAACLWGRRAPVSNHIQFSSLHPEMMNASLLLQCWSTPPLSTVPPFAQILKGSPCGGLSQLSRQRTHRLAYRQGIHKHGQKERNVVSPGNTRESCGLTTDSLGHPKLSFWLPCLSHSDPTTYSLARAKAESLFICGS